MLTRTDGLWRLTISPCSRGYTVYLYYNGWAMLGCVQPTTEKAAEYADATWAAREHSRAMSLKIWDWDFSIPPDTEVQYRAGDGPRRGVLVGVSYHYKKGELLEVKNDQGRKVYIRAAALI